MKLHSSVPNVQYLLHLGSQAFQNFFLCDLTEVSDDVPTYSPTPIS